MRTKQNSTGKHRKRAARDAGTSRGHARPWGFSLRLLIGFALVILVTVMAFSFLLLGRLENYLLHDMENSLANQVKMARGSVEYALTYLKGENLASLKPATRAGLQILTRQLATQTGDRILVTDQNGKEVLYSATATPGSTDFGRFEEISEAIKKGYGADTRTDPLLRQFTMYVAYPVHDASGKVTGVIRVSKGVNSVSGLLGTMRRRIVFSGVLAGGVAVLVSVVMAFTLAMPLQKIRDATIRFGKGDLSARSGLKGAGEMAELSRAFDRMADRIEKTVDELGELDKMKSNFVANVSHDLRTPLAAIKGLSETLLDGAIDDREVNSKFVLDILSESERLLLMVNNVLNLARIEAGAAENHVESIDPLEVVESVLDRMSPVARSVGVDLAVEEPEARVTVSADSMMLEQALANVVDNAIKFSSAGGVVRVLLEPESGEQPGAVIRVVDTGCGMAPEEMDDLFERFHASTDRSGGAGLGLAIARQAVEASGGSIEVHSEPGTGTTVIIRLHS